MTRWKKSSGGSTWGEWVRLKHGLNVLVTGVEAEEGRIVRVTADADLGSRSPKEAKHKAKTALHWLSVDEAVPVEAHRYGPLFDTEGEFDAACVKTAPMLVETGLAKDAHYEFERLGYFYAGGRVVHHLASLKPAGGR